MNNDIFHVNLRFKTFYLIPILAIWIQKTCLFVVPSWTEHHGPKMYFKPPRGFQRNLAHPDRFTGFRDHSSHTYIRTFRIIYIDYLYRFEGIKVKFTNFFWIRKNGINFQSNKEKTWNQWRSAHIFWFFVFN